MYNFDKVIDRRNTNSGKYDTGYAKDHDVIPMWVADMDFETLPEIKEALIKRAEHGIFGYSFVTDDYLEAVVHWMESRHDFKIEKEWIVTTTGVVTALKLAVRAFTKENDSIIVLKPVYYPFDYSIEANHRKVVECPLILEDYKYHIDFNLFEKLIIENDVKMFILCNPHNPIGRVWTKGELKKLGTICKEHDVIVVSDEIHMDFIYEGHTHYPFYEVDESFKEFSIIATAASKTFNLAGLECSNIIIANQELRETYEKEKFASGVTDPNIMGMDATQTAYTYGSQWVDELVAYLSGNVHYMKDYLEEYLPDIKMIEPEGLYLIWVDCKALGLNSKELEKFMIEEAHLWLDEGYIFGTGGEGFERFNVACPRSTLEKALNQFKEAVYNQKKL